MLRVYYSNTIAEGHKQMIRFDYVCIVKVIREQVAETHKLAKFALKD